MPPIRAVRLAIAESRDNAKHVKIVAWSEEDM